MFSGFAGRLAVLISLSAGMSQHALAARSNNWHAPKCQAPIWQELLLSNAPSPRQQNAMSYDRTRDRMVVCAGSTPSNVAIRETWETDGENWFYMGPIGPRAGQGEQVATVYDRVRGATLAVRGVGSSQVTETWEWNGSTWSLRASLSNPAGRFGFAITYDVGRNRTVMFGGKNGLTGTFRDTWEWDGAVWQLQSSTGPARRLGHAMAYDEARGVTVLFGGHDTTLQVQLGDTWEWDGATWQQRATAGPGPRSDHRMLYDESRQRIVLHSGYAVYGGGGNYSDVWEWDGTSWQYASPSLSSGLTAGFAYDSKRERSFLFSGVTPGGTFLNSTWVYSRTTHVAAVAPYGTGCPGPAGTPDLSAVAGSMPTLGSQLDLVIHNLPTGLLNIGLGWLGFDDTQWNGVALPLDLSPAGMPGCFALLDPASTFALSNAGGAAAWSLHIPFLPAFAGMSFYMQGGVLVLGYNPGGVVLSNALVATIGA